MLPYLTKNIPQTCARFFRVTGRQLVSLDLFTVSKINHSQEVGGFGIVHDFWKYGTAYSSDAIRTSDVVNLTGKMTPDGRLECTLPAGRWRIYRFGWSITGKINHPASPEATGLEVDKLSTHAWMRYFHTYVDLYKNAADGMLGKKRHTLSAGGQLRGRFLHLDPEISQKSSRKARLQPCAVASGAYR